MISPSNRVQIDLPYRRIGRDLLDLVPSKDVARESEVLRGIENLLPVVRESNFERVRLQRTLDEQLCPVISLDQRAHRTCGSEDELEMASYICSTRLWNRHAECKPQRFEDGSFS